MTGTADQVIKAIVFCPWCRRQHVDRGFWATKPHRTHLCEHCNEEFDASHPMVSGVDVQPPAMLELSMKESLLRRAADKALELLENPDWHNMQTSREVHIAELKGALTAEPVLIPHGVHGNGCAKCGNPTFGKLCAKCKGEKP